MSNKAWITTLFERMWMSTSTVVNCKFNGRTLSLLLHKTEMNWIFISEMWMTNLWKSEDENTEEEGYEFVNRTNSMLQR